MTIRDDGLPVEALLLLRAARETGALDALAERAGTPAALAAETALTPAAAETVVRTLADLGFLERVGDEYEFTNRALGFLAKRDLRSVGTLPAELDAINALVALPATMTGPVAGEGADGETVAGDVDAESDGDAETDGDNHLRNRLGAAAAEDEATVRARVTAATRAQPDAETVLVVGDGAGTHAREFAARGLDATLLDGEAVVAAVDPLLAPTDVTTTAGSLAAAELADLVFAAALLTELGREEAAFTVEAAAERLREDGALVFVEPVRERLESETVVARDVRRLAEGSGRVHALDDYREWFTAAGLDLTVEPVPGMDAVALVGQPERAVLGD
ncbi:hypothetical protein JCM17823_16140 [Halorubrum gandharaense]